MSQRAWTYTDASLQYTIIHKIFETDSSFHVKQRTVGKVQVLFFCRFLLLLAKFSFREEDWALGSNCMIFLICPNFLRSTLRFNCGDRKIFSTIKKFENIMNMTVHRSSVSKILFYNYRLDSYFHKLQLNWSCLRHVKDYLAKYFNQRKIRATSSI